MFSKFFSIFFALFIIFISGLMCMSSQINMNLLYWGKYSGSLDYFSMGIQITNISVSFIFMILIITSLVCLYSEFYMEYYNNLKFFLLMLMFFFSMVILCLSSSLILFMFGWDMLGLTSICLIMFYPNKMTLYNSFLTMIFNRIGDVCLLICLGVAMNFCSDLYHFISFKHSSLLTFMMICAFTKSAQMPLSSWLPAAMSAPTPISAMVHSSTLVTAGIYLIFNLYFHIIDFVIHELILMISTTTFLIGGFLACMEMDLKKMIAFSTMSQISMILFFCCMMFIFVSFLHTILHAMYKTVLFCCSGILFTFSVSSQNTNMISNLKNNSFMKLMFVLSIYSMSGLLYSSSFFTKDLMLENSYMNLSLWLFMALSVGSILTLVYSSMLMSNFLTFKFMSLTEHKNYMFLFLFFFLFLLIMCASFLKQNFSEVLFLLSSLDFLLLTLILMLPLIKQIKMKESLNRFTGNMLLMKFNSFSIFQNIMKVDPELFFSEYFYLKKDYLVNNFISKPFRSPFSMTMSCVVLTIMYLMFLFF